MAKKKTMSVNLPAFGERINDVADEKFARKILERVSACENATRSAAMVAVKELLGELGCNKTLEALEQLDAWYGSEKQVDSVELHVDGVPKLIVKSKKKQAVFTGVRKAQFNGMSLKVQCHVDVVPMKEWIERLTTKQ